MATTVDQPARPGDLPPRGAGTAAADSGRIRALGWRPLRHFTERSLAGLAVVLGAGVGFGVLLMLVRVRFPELVDADRSVAHAANNLVAPHPPVVTVLEAISQLGGRPVLLWLVTVAVILLLVRRRPRLAVYVVVAGIGALFLARPSRPWWGGCARSSTCRSPWPRATASRAGTRSAPW